MIRNDLVDGLNSRTGVAKEALEQLPSESLTSHFAKTANPALMVAKMMAASPLLLTALYTAGTGRFITAGLMAAVGGYLAFGARGDYEKNQNVTEAVTRQMALGGPQ